MPAQKKNAPKKSTVQRCCAALFQRRNIVQRRCAALKREEEKREKFAHFFGYFLRIFWGHFFVSFGGSLGHLLQQYSNLLTTKNRLPKLTPQKIPQKNNLPKNNPKKCPFNLSATILKFPRNPLFSQQLYCNFIFT